VDDVQKLREQSARAFRLAASISDALAKQGLETLGHELAQKAAEIERQEKKQGEQDSTSGDGTR
jgi:hypothetical protein